MPAPRDQGLPVNVTQSLSITYNGAAPAVAGQLVDFNGQLVTGNALPVFGVLREDASPGRTVSVAVAGLCEVLAGGVFSVPGSIVCSDASGRGQAGGAGTYIFGRNLSNATAVGQKIQVFITREGNT
jgi:Uncharacterized conserved protein (DUF2190)